jgi:hypothetical protein
MIFEMKQPRTMDFLDAQQRVPGHGIGARRASGSITGIS